MDVRQTQKERKTQSTPFGGMSRTSRRNKMKLTSFDEFERDLLLILQRLVQLRMYEVTNGDPKASDSNDRNPEVGRHGRAASSAGGHD